ncbi:hypothetical protein [Nocardioides lianchengensis]|uniref:Uncharacterized protein n=1 Tax=Nocardioides lianchengensis TaxID=1045774 RepID=A0A1G6VC75_9ACTN|nr:hypothetical protein [Nocardioides lianchengensis]NYG11230.1 hypothetical protein [Nocardioides lianchengensis]SDD51249.1 hypothetical protein SAMN05421872_108282 [Nocardioides lianchengensis]
MLGSSRSPAAGPPDRVLDLFVVPDAVVPLVGARGGQVVAGDLVLSPDRDAGVLAWLNPLVARLAVRLDERPGRDPRDLRLAMPVPARDGSWVVDGWAASRYEPGTTVCTDLDVVVATAHLLHAELAVAVSTRPEALPPVDEPDAQLVDANLVGNVLLDARGAPVVLDVEPAWRPARWAVDRLLSRW